MSLRPTTGNVDLYERNVPRMSWIESRSWTECAYGSPATSWTYVSLFRHVKGRAEANRATRSIDASADNACRYLLDLTPRERLRKAGVLSGNFWLTTWPD